MGTPYKIYEYPKNKTIRLMYLVHTKLHRLHLVPTDLFPNQIYLKTLTHNHPKQLKVATTKAQMKSDLLR